jgi:hypothetical protein
MLRRVGKWRSVDLDTMKGRLDSPLVYKGGYHTNPKDKGGYDEPDPSDPQEGE